MLREVCVDGFENPPRGGKDAISDIVSEALFRSSWRIYFRRSAERNEFILAPLRGTMEPNAPRRAGKDKIDLMNIEFFPPRGAFRSFCVTLPILHSPSPIPPFAS